MPMPVGGLTTADLAGEWDWVGFSSKSTFRASGENLIWTDQAGQYTLTKVPGEHLTFQYDDNTTIKFTSKDTAQFIINGQPKTGLKRIAAAAFDPTGTWSNADGGYTIRLTLVAGGLTYADDIGQWRMEQVPGQPNSYRLPGNEFGITFNSNDTATISFQNPMQMTRN
jgi:hypothetical protein